MKKTDKQKPIEEMTPETDVPVQETPVEEQPVEEQPVEDGAGENTSEDEEEAPKSAGKTKVEIPEFIDRILSMNPQYKRMYVSRKGFVYPEGTPEYQRKDAVLYENKYYNKQKQ